MSLTSGVSLAAWLFQNLSYGHCNADVSPVERPIGQATVFELAANAEEPSALSEKLLLLLLLVNGVLK